MRDAEHARRGENRRDGFGPLDRDLEWCGQEGVAFLHLGFQALRDGSRIVVEEAVGDLL